MCVPQRGAEQDSHEALRVLLDGLDTEEAKRLRLDAGPGDETAGGVPCARIGHSQAHDRKGCHRRLSTASRLREHYVRGVSVEAAPAFSTLFYHRWHGRSSMPSSAAAFGRISKQAECTPG